MGKLKGILAAFNMGTRKVIAIALTILFVYLALKGRIESAQVTSIYAVIIGFYFGKSTALDDPMGRVNKDQTNKGE